MSAFWEEALQELRAGRKVFLAFVASCSKGSPGTPKAKLLVKEDGSQFGTVGGGIMEQRLLQNAVKALRQSEFPPRLQKIAHQAKANNPSGLICGGAQTNALAVLTPERDSDTVRNIVEAIETESDSAIQLSPRGLESLPLAPYFPHPSCLHEDGEDWTLQLSSRPSRRIAIFGAGHCGQALAFQMKLLGYHVTLTDTRDPQQLARGVPHLAPFIRATPEKICRSIKHWPQTAVVVMTHSYPTDLDALEAILPCQPPFLGLMGSPPKLSKIRHELAERGFTSQQIASLRAPVGLAVGSDTPAEIAVSIAAQLLQEHNLHSIHAPDFADNLST